MEIKTNLIKTGENNDITHFENRKHVLVSLLHTLSPSKRHCENLQNYKSILTACADLPHL